MALEKMRSVAESVEEDEFVKDTVPISIILDHDRVGLIETGDLVGTHTLEEWRVLFNRYAKREVIQELSTRSHNVSREKNVDFEVFEKVLFATRMTGFNQGVWKDFKDLVKRANSHE